MIRVLIVDDHPVVRAGLAAVLNAHTELEIIGEAATGEQALQMAQHLRPDAVLCDLRLGEGMDGIATTSALRQLPTPPAVVMLTTFDRDADVLRAVEAGACGYLLKDVSTDHIVDALQRAVAGETVLSPELRQRLATPSQLVTDPLTDRELEVLRHLAQGLSNREIAKTLFISEATVKTHLVHVFGKLDVDSRGKAVTVAHSLGLI